MNLISILSLTSFIFSSSITASTPPSLPTPTPYILPPTSNSTTPSLNTTNGEILCYLNPTLIYPFNPLDCYAAMQTVLLLPHAVNSVSWYRTRHPIAWSVGTCIITIVNVLDQPIQQDSFPPVMVAVQAARVIDRCGTARTGSLGGQTRVGPRNVFWVQVHGFVAGKGSGASAAAVAATAQNQTS